MGFSLPFNKTFLTGGEEGYIKEALAQGHLQSGGTFTKKCEALLRERLGVMGAILVHSCTTALEMSALLADISPGDEVILPSFTFVSTANAFVLHGAVPVFVDIRPDTLNIDETLIEAAITPRTKAIVPVHYAGVSCHMEAICALAKKHHLLVIEDAAQCVGASYKGNALGSMGDMATFSFHATKNIISGEGGALATNTPPLLERAEIIRDKGTNRTQFFKGEVDKYQWVDKGSSCGPSEIVAAFLTAQLEDVPRITQNRRAIWDAYHEALAPLEGRIHRPTIPPEC